MKQRLLCFLVLSLYCCTKETEITESELAPTVRISLETTSQNIVESKATVREEFNTINLFVFDSEGSLLYQRYYDNIINNTLTFVGVVGKSQVIMIANVEEITSAITSIDDITSLSEQTTNLDAMYTDKTIELERATSSSQVVDYGTFYFTRYIAKVSVVLDFTGLDCNVSITPTQIAIKQIPSSVVLWGDNTPKTSEITSDGDSYRDNLTPRTHQDATPFYMFENLQGTGSYTNEKRPARGSRKCCTYIEITTEYTLYCDTYEVTYRHYIGNNETDNFDINRNTWYRYTVYFTGYGGFYENSWRVSITR
ncbi:MAG: DUF4906 domain-containing protein [Rikenellaceae bacterium]